VTKLT